MVATETRTALDRLRDVEPDLARDLDSRVSAGAKLLDRVEPGWHRRIALDRLAMESCDQCILGQLHGQFWSGFLSVLRPLPSTVLFSAAGFGFTLRDSEQNLSACVWPVERVRLRFAALGCLWRIAVLKRVSSDG